MRQVVEVQQVGGYIPIALGAVPHPVPIDPGYIRQEHTPECGYDYEFAAGVQRIAASGI